MGASMALIGAKMQEIVPSNLLVAKTKTLNKYV